MLLYEILVGVAISLSVLFFLLGRRATERPVQAEEQIGRYLASDPKMAQATLGDGLTQLSFLRRVILPTWQSILARLGSLT